MDKSVHDKREKKEELKKIPLYIVPSTKKEEWERINIKIVGENPFPHDKDYAISE